jgi:hypothetical protein
MRRYVPAATGLQRALNGAAVAARSAIRLKARRRNGSNSPRGPLTVSFVSSVRPNAAAANVTPPQGLRRRTRARYRLYSSTPDGLRRGAVFHQPYPLCRAEVTAWDEQLLTLNGFVPAGRPPDHVVMSPGVDVTVFPLERV